MYVFMYVCMYVCIYVCMYVLIVGYILGHIIGPRQVLATLKLSLFVSRSNVFSSNDQYFS